MNYAVFESGGNQYKVQKGDVLEVEKVENDGKSVIFDKVLLQVEDDKVTIGTPYITGAQISAKVISEKKGEKIHVLRYRSKSRHRRRVGHRHSLTLIEIQELSSKKTTSREKKS